MNFRYLFLRVLRHLMPEVIARFLLKRRWIIRPGLESSDPFAAVDKYINTLEKHGKSIKEQRILVFGYGGRFAVGVELLSRGASHVVLCDHVMSLDRERNVELLPKYNNYLDDNNGEAIPRSEYITLLHGDIRDVKVQEKIHAVDLVLSTSVYEHLDDVEGITHALTKLTTPEGTQLHFVDLRDHYFKYPFEMLKYSEAIWKKFLNPTSNLNRFRLDDYKQIFDSNFQVVVITALEKLVDEFRKSQESIRPEFKRGDESVDSVTLLQIFSSRPKL